MTSDDKALGNAAFSAGDFQTAIGHFTKGIQSDPNNHVLYSNRSACYASLNDYTHALEDAEKTVTLNPTWAKGYSRKGAALHGLGNYEDAEATYLKGLEIEPTNASLKKGLEDIRAAQTNDAVDGLGSVFSGDVFAKIAAKPSLAPLLAQPDLVAKIQEIQKNPKAAAQYMQDPRMMNIMLGLMGLDGHVASSPEEAQETMRSYETPDKKAKTETPAEPIVELSEEEKSFNDKRTQSDAEKSKGNEAYKKRSFDEALKHYESAWNLDNSNVAVLTNQAAALFEMEKYADVISTCEKAVELGREHRVDFKLIGRALARIGAAYAKLNDLENAIKFYGKSLSEHRTADVLAKLREMETLKKKADEEKYRDPVLADEAREKGNALFKAQDFSTAVRHYTEAIKRNPFDPKNYSNRAACYIKLMALPEADKDCDKALECDPAFIKAIIRKANIQFSKREYMKCVDLCNEALEKDSEGKHTAEIQSQVQRAYAGLGNVQAGTREETLARAANNPEVQRIMNDPVMSTILKQMQEDPMAAQDHMKNPDIAAKIRVLINAGIIQTR